MAPKKKKTKATASSARGFATTSTPSKARVDPIEEETPTEQVVAVKDGQASKSTDAPAAVQASKQTNSKAKNTPKLSPEEFERQLVESELQLLVEKNAQKTRR